MYIFILTMFIHMISWVAITKYHRQDGLVTEIYALIDLEARNWGSKCQLGQVLVKAFFVAYR